MNRLTRQISLVLISSSLFLYGCADQEGPRDEKDRENQPGGGTSHPSHHTGGHSGGWFPMFWGGSSRSTGIRSGSHTSSSSSSSSSHVGGSSRGGFGGSAHGVSS